MIKDFLQSKGITDICNVLVYDELQSHWVKVQRPLAIDFVIRYNEGKTFYNVLTSWICLKAESDGYTSSFCHFTLLSSKFGWNILMMIRRVKTKLALCSSFASACQVWNTNFLLEGSLLLLRGAVGWCWSTSFFKYLFVCDFNLNACKFNILLGQTIVSK